MFRKEEEIEHDFMEYGKEDTPVKKEEANVLSKMIQLLSVVVLLGIVGFMGIFGYKYIQKDTFTNKDKSIDPESKKSVKTVSSEDSSKHIANKNSAKGDTKQKMYTQEEMQAIVKTLMAQTQTVKQTDKKQIDDSGSSSKVSDAPKDKALVTALNNVEVDQLEDIKEDVPLHVNQDKIYKAKTKKSTKKVDHYNKVVVQTSKNTYDDLANLSLEIGNVVDDMKNNKKQSSYTSSIKKEVVTRSNEMRVIVVKQGDSLSKIAKRAYGSAKAYNRIMEANPDLIKNPDHIYIGQRLRVPLENN